MDSSENNKKRTFSGANKYYDHSSSSGFILPCHLPSDEDNILETQLPALLDKITFVTDGDIFDVLTVLFKKKEKQYKVLLAYENARQDQQDKLRDEHVQLQSKYDKLKNDHDQLQSKCDKLQSECNVLRTEYNAICEHLRLSNSKIELNQQSLIAARDALLKALA